MSSLLLLAVITSCAAAPSLINLRGGDATVLAQGGTYNYVPSIMQDGRYRAWWCAGCEGDCIFYSESSSLDGGWSRPEPVFKPTLKPTDFDGQHTCDPSVLRVDGVLYLYYGGFPLTPSPTPQYTAVGLAISHDDGKTFDRANGGKAIVSAALQKSANLYGAGQPSVVFLDGSFYMVYTDTTGRDSGGSGNVAYVLRASDPTFQSGVQELNGLGGGFSPYSSDTHTSKAFFSCVSVDWLFSDIFDSFVLGCDGFNSSATTLVLFDRQFTNQSSHVDLRGHWTEGPGLVKRPDQHAQFLPSAAAIDVMRSVGPGGPNTWTLAHSGADLIDPSLSVPVSRQIAALEGYLLEAAGMPLTVVVGGKRLQFALAGPATRLAQAVASVNTTVFNWVPYGASVQKGQAVLGAPGRPAAFLLDDGCLWPVSCLEIITDNGSNIQEVSVAEFDSHVAGPSLYCIGTASLYKQ